MDNRLDRTRTTFEGNAPARWTQVVALAASLTLGLLAPAAADAQETTTEVSNEESTDDASLVVERKIEEWLNDGPGRAFRKKGDLNIVQGISLVAVKTDNPRWAKARSLAFQNAFVQAMGKYVASVRQRTSVNLVRNYLSEDIPESELEYQEGESHDSYVERIFLKSAVLAEQKLDDALAESGMSDDEIQRLTTPVQKRTTLKERVSRKTLNTAIGSAAGLIPARTFEGLDDEGNSAIGVVAVYSERMRHIANQISRGKVIRPDPSRARNPIADQIASYASDELPKEFGVRVWWDEQGYPVVVSFGQWGWSPANLSKRKRAQRRKFAMKQAGNDALSNLTVFIKASTRFTEESTVGADIEEGFKLPRGGIPEEVEAAAIVDKLVETANVKAEVSLTGYTQERTWSASHPLLDEHKVVGVVAYWSPAREDAIRKTVGREAKHAPSQQVSRTKKKKHVSGGLQSREPDLADF